jgi:hypothetical protein
MVAAGACAARRLKRENSAYLPAERKHVLGGLVASASKLLARKRTYVPPLGII